MECCWYTVTTSSAPALLMGAHEFEQPFLIFGHVGRVVICFGREKKVAGSNYSRARISDFRRNSLSSSICFFLFFFAKSEFSHGDFFFGLSKFYDFFYMTLCFIHSILHNMLCTIQDGPKITAPTGQITAPRMGAGRTCIHH